MSYNMEDQEDYLKHKMPYQVDDKQWEAMQARIKTKVLEDKVVPLVPERRRPVLKMAIGAAAGLLLLVSVYTLIQRTTVTQTATGIVKSENPEQYLDQTIGSLNEQELNWMHQVNENEIQDQDEYFDN